MLLAARDVMFLAAIFINIHIYIIKAQSVQNADYQIVTEEKYVQFFPK